MQASTKIILPILIDIVWKVFNEHFLCSSLRHKGIQTQSKNRKATRVVWQCIQSWSQPLASQLKMWFTTPR